MRNIVGSADVKIFEAIGTPAAPPLCQDLSQPSSSYWTSKSHKDFFCLRKKEFPLFLVCCLMRKKHFGTKQQKRKDRRMKEWRKSSFILMELELEWKRCDPVPVKACEPPLSSLFLFLFHFPSWCLVFRLQRRFLKVSVPTHYCRPVGHCLICVWSAGSFHFFYSLVTFCIWEGGLCGEGWVLCSRWF